MTQTIRAHYDGKSIVPDEPVALCTGQQLIVQIDVVDCDVPKFASLLDLAADVPDAPTNLSSQHDHYLYGTPIK